MLLLTLHFLLEEFGHERLLGSIVTVWRTTDNTCVRFNIDNEGCFVPFHQLTKQAVATHVNCDSTSDTTDADC